MARRSDGRRRWPRSAAMRRRAAAAEDATAQDITHPWPITESPGGKDFIDFDEDLARATSSIPCTTAMTTSSSSSATRPPASDRARAATPISTPSASSRAATGRDIQKVGTTTFRPPLVPEKFAASCRPRLRADAPHGDARPPRRALARTMMVAGLWMRPAYYGPREERARGDRARGARRARKCRHDRRLDAGRARHARAGCGRLHRPHVHLGLRQAAGRPRALCADDRPDRRHHRRRRRRRLHERHFYVTATTGAVDQVYRQMAGGMRNGGWMSTSPTSPPPMPASTSPARRRARVIEKLDSDIDFSRRGIPLYGSAGRQARRHSGARAARRLRRRAGLRDPLPRRASARRCGTR